jgi:hypothetical protein
MAGHLHPGALLEGHPETAHEPARMDCSGGAGARTRLRIPPQGPVGSAVYLVTGADPLGGAKVLVVGAQLGVVEVQARRGH